MLAVSHLPPLTHPAAVPTTRRPHQLPIIPQENHPSSCPQQSTRFALDGITRYVQHTLALLRATLLARSLTLASLASPPAWRIPTRLPDPPGTYAGRLRRATDGPMLVMHSCAAPPSHAAQRACARALLMRGAPPEPPAAIIPSRQVPADQLTSAIVLGPTLQALGTGKSLATADRQDLCYGETPVREPARTSRARHSIFSDPSRRPSGGGEGTRRDNRRLSGSGRSGNLCGSRPNRAIWQKAHGS